MAKGKNTHITVIGKGSKANIGAMGDNAKGKLVVHDGKVVKVENSTVDTSPGPGKHRAGDVEPGR